jgi:glycosyltransferase involved in cell wall biosynthesis
LDLVFVGRLVPGKQPLAFVEIVGRIARRQPALRAMLLGDGPLRDAVERRAAELGLGGCLEVAGQVADVADVLGRSRIFVLPSLSEGLSIALAEAMAAGAVPLATRVGDLADLVTDGVNGYLLDPFDHEGFVRHADVLLRDAAHWRRLSAAAASAARAHMDLPRVAALWSARLRETVQAAGGAGEDRRPAARRPA